jgi:predicted transcriptional regulator
MTETFDTKSFYVALDAVRRDNEITWKEVAVQSGVGASTLTRIGQGANPDIEGFARLLSWSGLKAEMFIRDIHPKNATSKIEKNQSVPIAQISSIIRTDASLSYNSAQLLEGIFLGAYETVRKAEKK